MTAHATDITLADLVLLEDERIAHELRTRGRPAVLRLRSITIGEVDAALVRLRDCEPFPDDGLAARILVGLGDVVTRDLATVVHPDDIGVAQLLWHDLATRAPEGYAAAPWTIRAVLCWQQGDRRGALRDAWAALEDDHDYTMAGYLVQACRHDLPMPAEWTDGTVTRRRNRLGGACRE
ncbi:MAG TPA: DUF4192 family protein [Mycobacteriales bacterium]|nr:DUF4192 family protein [Mycobacteriales bacterium]